MDLGGGILGRVRGDHAHQSLLKAGDEGARAQAQGVGGGVVPVGAALEFLAVHHTLIVDVGGITQLHGLIRDLSGAVVGGAVLEQDVVDVLHHVLVGDLQLGGQGELHIRVDRLLNHHVGLDVGLKVVVAGRAGLGLGGLGDLLGGRFGGRLLRGGLGVGLGIGLGGLGLGAGGTALGAELAAVVLSAGAEPGLGGGIGGVGLLSRAGNEGRQRKAQDQSKKQR